MSEQKDSDETEPLEATIAAAFERARRNVAAALADPEVLEELRRQREAIVAKRAKQDLKRA